MDASIVYSYYGIYRMWDVKLMHHSLDADSRLGISFQGTFYTVQ